MRRSIVAVLVPVLLIACSAGAPTEAEPNAVETPTDGAPTHAPTQTPAPTETPTATTQPDIWQTVDPTDAEISFWHTYSGRRGDVIEAIIADFNATNTYNITVVGERKGNLGELFDITLTSLSSTEAPNLVVAYQNHAATYLSVEPNSIVDVTSLINSPMWGLDEDEDYIDAFFEGDRGFAFNEGQYGFAPNRSMSVLFYNTSWLAELGYDVPPSAPASFREVACAAREQSFSFGSTPAIGYAVRIEASVLASWIFAFGGEVFDQEELRYQYASPEAIEAVTFLQALVQEGCARVVDGSFEDQAAFARGQALFAVGSTAGLPFYASAVDEGPGFDWTVGAIPHVTAQPAQNIYGPGVSILAATPEEELASWLFLKYHTDVDPQRDWATATSYYPVRVSAAEAVIEAGNQHPAYAAAFDLREFVKAEPATPNYEAVRQMANEALRDILEGAEVEDRLEQLNDTANQTLP